MILQGHISKKIGSKKYIKHVIVIPSDVIKELDWVPGKIVKYYIKDKELRLR